MTEQSFIKPWTYLQSHTLIILSAHLSRYLTRTQPTGPGMQETASHCCHGNSFHESQTSTSYVCHHPDNSMSLRFSKNPESSRQLGKTAKSWPSWWKSPIVRYNLTKYIKSYKYPETMKKTGPYTVSQHYTAAFNDSANAYIIYTTQSNILQIHWYYCGHYCSNRLK